MVFSNSVEDQIDSPRVRQYRTNSPSLVLNLPEAFGLKNAIPHHGYRIEAIASSKGPFTTCCDCAIHSYQLAYDQRDRY